MTKNMYDPQIPELEYEKYICTECYRLGTHGDVTYGNWGQYWGQAIIMGPIIVIPTLLYLVFIFAVFVLFRGKFVAIDTMDMFPLMQYMPEKPHTVTVCPHCKKVNCQAKIKDGNGQTALYFHKKTGLHLQKAPAEKPTQTECKHNPDEF